MAKAVLERVLSGTSLRVRYDRQDAKDTKVGQSSSGLGALGVFG